ncbi:hypothetical protein [Laceyella putida]|uniref:Uncharacterized protein n=1 Tax=Laceyella putida TaxID=110101 RepID=A0ABW2RPT3_9BACL
MARSPLIMGRPISVPVAWMMSLESNLKKVDQRANQILTKTEKTLIKEYRRALQQIRRELADLYATFPMSEEQRSNVGD